jgi:hypothetical protein
MIGLANPPANAMPTEKYSRKKSYTRSSDLHSGQSLSSRSGSFSWRSANEQTLYTAHQGRNFAINQICTNIDQGLLQDGPIANAAIAQLQTIRNTYTTFDLAADPHTNYNLPPWHLSQQVPGCCCDGCRTLVHRNTAQKQELLEYTTSDAIRDLGNVLNKR